MIPRTRIEPCRIHHKTWATRAKCEWPYAAAIVGDDRFALVLFCGPVTVRLYGSQETAAASLARLDRVGCGDRCRHAHRLVDLAWPHRAWTSKVARR